MTWAEFKRLVEGAGVTDETEIDLIDVKKGQTSIVVLPAWSSGGDASEERNAVMLV